MELVTAIEAAEEYRRKVRTTIEKAMRTSVKLNTNKEKYCSLKNLKANTSLKILPANTGNETDVINVEKYKEKLQQVLMEGKYKLLLKDPTTSVEAKTY